MRAQPQAVKPEPPDPQARAAAWLARDGSAGVWLLMIPSGVLKGAGGGAATPTTQMCNGPARSGDTWVGATWAMSNVVLGAGAAHTWKGELWRKANKN